MLSRSLRVLAAVSLIPLVPALAPTLAFADTAPAAIVAAPATTATSPEVVFDHAVNVHYDAMMDGEPCKAPCAQTIVKRGALDGGREVQLRKANTEYGDVYAVVFGADATWFAADPLDDIEQDDCGMGKCVSDVITSVTFKHTATRVWITLALRTEIAHNESGTRESHRHAVVIGCSLGAAPTCATIFGGGHWTDGSVRLVGDRALVRDDGVRSRVPVQF